VDNQRSFLSRVTSSVAHDSVRREVEPTRARSRPDELKFDTLSGVGSIIEPCKLSVIRAGPEIKSNSKLKVAQTLRVYKALKRCDAAPTTRRPDRR
jgi:hypothetical protein